MVHDSIELNATEQELFDILLSAVKHSGKSTTVRCAGGWVRDKLLGKSSLDIDVALDNMLGKDFAELVNTYLTSQGKATRTAAVIQSNPDQSKHLETARMKINDIWIDLVNLRSETYAQDSRIPQMEFGTPEQDAFRRDFTINSMFYSATKGCLEDLTGKGVEDLRKGIIRTPLPPMETFLDDPLRVLRAVRFGTRFGFELDPELVTAASSEQVCSALGSKVSRERVGTELDGMFNGPSPFSAVELLVRLSLFPVVFALPPVTAGMIPADHSMKCLACMGMATALVEANPQIQMDLESRRFLLLAALLLPLAQAKVAGLKGKTTPVTAHVVRESIKWRAKDAEMTALLHESAGELLSIYLDLTHGKDTSQVGADLKGCPDALKLRLGGAIRKLKQHWRLGVLLAPLLQLPEAAPLGVELHKASGSATAPAGKAAAGALSATALCADPAVLSAAAHGSKADPGCPASADVRTAAAEQLSSALLPYQEVSASLLAAAEAWGLQDCWQWKPLLDGKQVQQLLHLQKPGPELGKAMAAALDWQLVHPEGQQSECEQYVVAWWQQQPRR